MADITGTIYGSTSNSQIDSRITWSETVDVAANTGSVTAILALRTRTGYTAYSHDSDFTITINGTAHADNNNYISIGPGTSWVDCSTFTLSGIPHNNDGSKTITISASGVMVGTSVSSISCSASVALYQIPRASTISSPTPATQISCTGTNAVTVSIVRQSTEYTHFVKMWIGSDYDTADSRSSWAGIGTSLSYTIPIGWRYEAQTSTIATVNIEVQTQDASQNNIGEPATTTFQIMVPDTVRPIVNTTNAVLSPYQSSGTSGFSSYVQGYTQAEATFSGTAAAFSSEVPISSYYISVGGTPTTTAPYRTALLGTAGSIEITLGVVDSRGRTGIRKQTITVYSYSAPTLTGLSVFRSNGSGVASDSGGYVSCSQTSVYSTCNGENSIATLRARYKTAASSTYGSWSSVTDGGTTLIGGGALVSTTSYDVQIEVTDTVGNPTPYTFRIPTASVAFHIRDGGNGGAFGKYGESDNLWEFASAIKSPGATFTSGISITGNATATGTISGNTLNATDKATTRTNLGITLSNLGAAAASHNHSATDINTGTLALDRYVQGTEEINALLVRIGVLLRTGVSPSFTVAAAATTDQAVTFATAFASGVTPKIVLTLNATGSAYNTGGDTNWCVLNGSISNTGFTIRVWNKAASSYSATFNYIAMA